MTVLCIVSSERESLELLQQPPCAMLSNNDFRQLLDPKRGDGAGQPGRSQQFDIKTIAKWDSENRRKTKQRQHQKGDRYGKDSAAAAVDSSVGGAGKKERLNEDGSKYRDRAEERRLNQTSDEFDVEMEAAASRLSAEQTKFLGGDESRTHLVKGLDFLLLQKTRGKAADDRSASNTHRPSAAAAHDRVGGVDGNAADGSIRTCTEMGARLKALCLQNGDSTKNRSSNQANKQKQHLLQSIRYEFDMSTDFYQEIPAMVSSSTKEAGGRKEGSERQTADLPADILDKLADYIGAGGHKKRKLSEREQQPTARLQSQLPTVDKIVDIYGDIFDDVDAHVSSEIVVEKVGRDNSRDVADFAGVKASSLGLFSSAYARDGSKEDEAGGVDMMAPVKTLLRAQALRDRASEAAMAAAAAATAAAPVAECSGDGKGLVHRNVFGVEQAAVRKGEALAHGSYDMFGGDDGSEDDYGSDDGGDEKPAKKLNWNKEKKTGKGGGKKQ